MNIFNMWWTSLSSLQQVLALAAIPGTLILIIQTVLLLVGIGHGGDTGEFDHDHDFGADHDFDTDHDFDADHDLDTDHDFDHDHDHADVHAGHDGAEHTGGIRLFTLRGIVAFFAVGGWVGIAMCDLGLSDPLCLLIAVLSGTAALLLAAFIIAYALKLQESGNIVLRNAIMQTATVYIPIPPSRSGTGKVTMTLQERFVELDAMTDSDAPLPTGTQVQIVSVSGGNELVVRPLISVK